MNPDNRIMNFLGKLGDMFILNILYIICCIPVITIGAATAALYYTTLKMAENREPYVWSDYWKAFKENFRQATVIWLIMLALMAVLAADILLLGSMGQELGSIVAVTVIAAGIFLVLPGIYVFPVLARFDNTVRNTMKNAMIMSFRHFPSTILILLIHGLPLLMGFVSVQALIKGVWVVLFFVVSILAYAESKFFTRIFSKYYPGKERDNVA